MAEHNQWLNYIRSSYNEIKPHSLSALSQVTVDIPIQYILLKRPYSQLPRKLLEKTSDNVRAPAAAFNVI